MNMLMRDYKEEGDYMYPNHLHLYNNNPFTQEAYLYSTPFQEENYYHPAERQFGPPTAPPPSYVPA